MKLTVFDLVTHLGGAQRSTIEFVERVRKVIDVSVVDAYGACEKHLEWLMRIGIDTSVLVPDARFTTIGFRDRPLRRVWRALRAVPELQRVKARLRRYLEDARPDVMMVISPKALRLAYAACGRLGVPIIYWCRTSDIPTVIRERGLDKYVATYVCLSEAARNRSVEHGYCKEKIHVVPNAIDVDQLREFAQGLPQPPIPDQHRGIRLLLAATLLPTKGQDCAIRAIQRLRKAGHDAVLYLAGDTAQAGPGHKDYLRQLAARCGVEDVVHFLGWREDVPRLLRAATMLVLPSHSEGMPRIVMEAMSLGIPVAATRVGAIPELLEDGAAGWLIEVDDDAALANAIIQASMNPELRRSRTTRAAATVAARYSSLAQLKAFNAVLDAMSLKVVCP